VKIFIINLPKSKKRLAFQQQQLGELGLKYTVIKAIGVNDLSDVEYKKFSGTWQRLMRRTEVACFLSHKKAWEAVIEHGQPCLILEDDVLLSKKIPELLAEIFALKDRDLVTLEVRSRKKIVSKKSHALCCDSHLLALYQDRTGAAGYVLWPRGANKLLTKCNKNKIGLADAFISSSYELQAYQVEPAPLIQLDQCDKYGVASNQVTESVITPQDTSHPVANKVSERIRYKYRRIIAQLRMGVRHLLVSFIGKRRYISLNIHDFDHGNN